MKKTKYEDEEALIKKIKEKKELRGLSNSIVEEVLQNSLKKYNISFPNVKNSEIKVLIKEARAQLRKYSGQFQKSQKDRLKLLNSGKIQELLKTHSSTYERLEFYPTLKKIIAELAPSSILDLGCGLNPLALAMPSMKYYSFDINEDELFLIEQFFKKNKINGITKVYDLKKISDDLPEADLCIIFKVIDIVGESPNKLTQKILRTVRCKNFLISFSTVKISGKKMAHPERFWFEKILQKNNLKFKKFYSKNEIFYLLCQEPHTEVCSVSGS